MSFCLCILLAVTLAGCAGRTTTETIRHSIAAGDVSALEARLEETHKSYGEMVTALNLARIYQLEGRWRSSINAYTEALELLEEYENRAIVNLRGVAAGAGAMFLSRGAESYYCTGYERSLLHTFNALNYMMIGDFSGAAVEIRRMDQRQALWLEESQARIEKFLEAQNTLSSPDDLPQGYSMRELLRHESVRALINNYQDPFSYALGAVFFRLAGDPQAAEVSMRRAAALAPQTQELFAAAWASPNNRNKKILPPIPAPPAAPKPIENGDARSAGKTRATDTQEVTIIGFTGLAPSLGVENVRIWFPVIGYILIDLPTYTGAVYGTAPSATVADMRALKFYPLLRTDLLAYRTLWDEVRMEAAFAATRAATRAGLAVGAYAAASSHEDTKDFAPLISQLTTLILDLFASSMAGSVRNWETLPNTGYMAMDHVPRGSTIIIGAGNDEQRIRLPQDARGVIVMITELSTTKLKVNHVAY